MYRDSKQIDVPFAYFFFWLKDERELAKARKLEYHYRQHPVQV